MTLTTMALAPRPIDGDVFVGMEPIAKTAEVDAMEREMHELRRELSRYTQMSSINWFHELEDLQEEIEGN